MRTRGNSDADSLEDAENYLHRSTNGRPPRGQHEGEGPEDSEQSNIVMMTDDNAGRSSSSTEKPPSGNDENAQEIAAALEEDAMMEKHDDSIKKILELFCLMGAGYWRLCQVSFLPVPYNFLSAVRLLISLSSFVHLLTVPMQRSTATVWRLATHPPQYWLGSAPRGQGVL